MLKIIKKIDYRSFWHYQILGFSLFWAFDILVILSSPNYTLIMILSESSETPICFGLTLLLRLIYKKINYKSLSLIKLLLIIILSSFIFTIIYYIIIGPGIWGLLEPKTLSHYLTLKTAAWWIFILFSIPLGWSFLYFGIKFWLDWDTEKKKAEEAHTLAQKVQLQTLRYTLNPQFLFNALTSIKAIIEEDRKQAQSMITDLSEFLRYSFISKKDTIVPLKNELNAIRSYLAIEKKRFDDKINITFQIEKEAEDFPILNFIIQPLVENAIKYGMETSPLPLEIVLRAAIENNYLHIKISNSGRWIKKSVTEGEKDTTGKGILNVKTRLENIYHNNFQFKTFEEEGNVFAFLEIPKEFKNKLSLEYIDNQIFENN